MMPPPPSPGPGERFALACGGLPPRAIVEAAEQAEELGFEAVWIGEGGLGPDAAVVAATVLGATRRIRCGPGVAAVGERHPVVLARVALTLDQLFPGRVVLGIGRGDPTTSAVTAAPPPPLAALADAARICRAALRGRAVEHRGRVWSARLAPPPPFTAPTAPIPLAIAAVGPRALQLAGELADVVLLNYGAPCEYVAWAREQVAAAARRAGREPTEVVVAGLVLVARTDAADGGEAALGSVRRALHQVYADPSQRSWLLRALGEEPRWDAPWLGRVAAVGDGPECHRRLAEYRRAGVDVIVLLPSGMRALFASAGTRRSRRSGEPLL